MTASPPSILVIGAGLFGLTAACDLARRGCAVRVVEPGPIPAPHAASNDISKVVRMEYGSDAFYSRWMIEALDGWRRWNARWDETVFHETGVLMMSRTPLGAEGFEAESLRTLEALGCRPERVDAATLRRRFPAWNAALYVDGFYHAWGGYARSDRVIERLADDAAALGVEILRGGGIEDWIEAGRTVRGAICGGTRLHTDEVVLAAGAWSTRLLPDLAAHFQTVAQPVFYLSPEDREPFCAGRFPVFTADIRRTGWYGMPANADGIVKLANHGPGRPLDPRGTRDVRPEEVDRLRVFLEESFPALARARLSGEKVCVYCDTVDGDFWIDRHPRISGLTVAAGGSGHAFKFAPVLGALIADVVLGRANPRRNRFRWREAVPEARREAARFSGEVG